MSDYDISDRSDQKIQRPPTHQNKKFVKYSTVVEFNYQNKFHFESGILDLEDIASTGVLFQQIMEINEKGVMKINENYNKPQNV